MAFPRSFEGNRLEDTCDAAPWSGRAQKEDTEQKVFVRVAFLLVVQEVGEATSPYPAVEEELAKGILPEEAAVVRAR